MIYEPGIHSDLLVLKWWERMAASGDLEKLFSVKMAECGAFMGAMRKMLLIYQSDERGIWSAAWFEPVMSGARFAGWIREDRRGSQDGNRAVIESIAFGLDRFPVLLSTWVHDPDWLEWLAALGFETLGTVPRLFEGTDVSVAFVTEDKFYRAAAGSCKRLYAKQEGESDGR